MGLVTWIIFGALAGWVASLLMGRDRQMGCMTNIIVGIVGAVLGGFLMNLLGHGQGMVRFDLRSFGIAVLGAVVFLGITGFGMRRRKKK